MSPALRIQPNSTGNILLLTFHIGAPTSTVVLNFLVVISIACSRTLRKQSRFVYILNAGISNFCTGGFWYYIGIFDVQDYGGRMDTYFIEPSFTGVACLVALTSQIDRHYAITHPFNYVKMVTLSRTCLGQLFTWRWPFMTVFIVNVVPNNMGILYNGVMTVFFAIFSFSAMIFLNIKLFILTRKKIKKTRSKSTVMSVYLVFLVAMSYIVLWLPTFINNIICILFKICIQGQYCFLCTLMRFPCITTPIISIAFSSSLRTSLRTLINKDFLKM